MDGEGGIAVERIALIPRRDVRCLRGTLNEILKGPQSGESRDDYVMVTLTDREPVLDPMGKLLPIYPNVLHIERLYLTGTGDSSGSSQDHRGLTDLHLFRAFFSQVTGEDLSSDEEQAFSLVVEGLRNEEREAN
jgi:exonuclease SbcD